MADRIRIYNGVGGVLEQSDFASGARIDGIDCDASGTIYAVDLINAVMYKVFQDGRTLGALAGAIGMSGDVEASGVQSVDGNDDGGQNARFTSLSNVAVDRSGRIWVLDLGVHKLKVCSASGRVKNVAGSTNGDVISDVGTSVKFNTPRGVAVDASGVVYVADTGNHKIKKVWENGKTVSLAGNVTGFINGQGRNARFASPRDCCVDKSGNIYVADTGNNTIRMLDQSGNVTIVAGGNSGAGTSGFTDANGPDARFNSPRRIALDPSGQSMYVVDYTNAAIRRVTPHGKVTTFCSFNKPTTHDGDVCVMPNGFVCVLENNV
jgi:sugar lactone lactonase YvrE